MKKFSLNGLGGTTMKRVLKEIGVFFIILAVVIFMSSIDSIIDLLLYK
jgi:hypothetical protein